MRVNFVLDSPGFPLFKVYTDFQVEEAVSQRARHTVGNTLVTHPVTSGNNHNIVGQLVSANATVED